jgi:hypothetical protein
MALSTNSEKAFQLVDRAGNANASWLPAVLH